MRLKAVTLLQCYLGHARASKQRQILTEAALTKICQAAKMAELQKVITRIGYSAILPPHQSSCAADHPQHPLPRAHLHSSRCV